MKLIGPEERLKEKRGVSIAIFGPTGVGKTTLARTLGATALSSTLVVDIEAGTLPIDDLPVAIARVQTMREFMDIACVIGGPDPALPPNSAFSSAHYAKVSADPELMKLAEYDTLFVDSLTALCGFPSLTANNCRRR
jgi:ABC-type glutathione transport system ATPase component